MTASSLTAYRGQGDVLVLACGGAVVWCDAHGYWSVARRGVVSGRDLVALARLIASAALAVPTPLLVACSSRAGRRGAALMRRLGVVVLDLGATELEDDTDDDLLVVEADQLRLVEAPVSTILWAAIERAAIMHARAVGSARARQDARELAWLRGPKRKCAGGAAREEKNVGG